MVVTDLKESHPPDGAGKVAEETEQKDASTKPGVKAALMSAAAQAELWHTPDGEPWASVGGQNWPVGSTQFRYWLIQQVYRENGHLPAESTVRNALQALAARAIYDGPEHAVHLRTAVRGGRIYLDLADGTGRAVRITADNWTVLAAGMVPTSFYRPPQMRSLALPVKPEAETVLTELRALLNLPTEDDFRLFLTAVTAAMRPRGPYPVLVISGEQGTGKSVLARVFRALVDPSSVPLSSPVKDERDLVARAKNNHVVAFDNVSTIRPDLADALCRLATGGGLGGRKLYTDADEAVFEAQRPIILNGIPELAWRGDLADRAVTFTLPSIKAEERLPEEPLWERFKAVHPAVFGRLLDAMVDGLKRLPEVQERVRRRKLSLPRMADFAVWGIAIAPGLGWSEEDFLTAYERNRRAVQLAVLEGDPVADALIRLVEGVGEWEGTATKLLKRLNSTNNSIRCFRGWPRGPASLGATIRRLRPLLVGVGVQVETDRSSAKRSIRLYKEGH